MHRPRRPRRLALAFLPAFLLVLALGGVAAARAATVEVQIAGLRFLPDALTIAVGDTVTWTNDDSAQHDVVAVDGAFRSAYLGRGERFSFTAATPGTFAYYCSIHPFMKATLVVEGGARGPRSFPETGKAVGGAFLAYWEATGGLAIHGFPLSDEFMQVLEDGREYRVQYFERTRLEYHPEAAGTPFEVQLGQFGRRIHPADPPVPAEAGATYFAETGHNLSEGFLAYWGANGGLALFGFPISEPITERLEDGREYRVQYFERARFEYHPENLAPFDILLGQFGRRILAEAGR